MRIVVVCVSSPPLERKPHRSAEARRLATVFARAGERRWAAAGRQEPARVQGGDGATPTTTGPSGKQDTFCLRAPSSLPPLLTHQTSLNIWHEWRRETSRRRPRTKERQLYGPPVAVGGQGPGPGGASPAGPAR
ncbi:hypothetical protein Bbelb_396810 [Branchiostoma belcheri]|nr:hypothetical protein Bbelb_396810 [Branchiostoma belcheri]